MPVSQEKKYFIVYFPENGGTCGTMQISIYYNYK